MEKTIKFSIFKEKIIKTNELLHLHLEKTRELDKVQKCYQQLKTKLEISKNEIRKFKLKHDSLSYNLKLTEKNYAALENEHEALKLQFNNLEQEFSETVNNLQINYQTTSQELQDCKDKLSKFEEKPFPLKPKSPIKRRKDITDSITEEKYAILQEEHESLKLKFNQLQKEFDNTVSDLKANSQETNQELQKCKEKLVEFENQNSDRQKTELTRLNVDILKELKQDKQKLVKENSNLKLEVYELKQERNCLQDGYELVEALKVELKKKERKITDLENNLKEIEGNKKQEIDELIKKLNRLKTENEKLQNENSSFKLDIAMLQVNNAECPKEIHKFQENNKALNEKITMVKEDLKKPAAITRQKRITPTSQEIEEIMKDITFPQLLSPFTEVNEETSSEKPIPDVNEESFSFATEVEKNKETHIVSSSGKFKISKFSEAMKISTRKKIFKRKKSNRKKSKKVNLYKTLLALKKANLNFIISNESLNPIDRIGPPLTRPAFQKFIPERKCGNVTFSSKLECNLKCCKSCHMLLRNDESLLGFFDVKSEKISCGIESNKQINSLKSRKKQEDEKEKVQQSTIINIDGGTEVANIDLSLENSESDNIYSVHNEQSLKRSTLKKSCLEKNSKSNRCILSVINNKKRTRTATKILNNDETLIIPVKKRIAHTPKYDTNWESIRSQNDDICARVLKDGTRAERITTCDNETLNHSQTSPLVSTQESKELPKTTFKRPICRTRKSPRLLPAPENTEIFEKPDIQEDTPSVCPRSPTPESQIPTKPKIIPLERVSENLNNKMPSTKIEMLFNKLINYSMEEEALNEVVREFSNQDPEYIAQAILEKISQDFYDTPTAKHFPAPLMTDTQRTMLGFMSKLEKSNVIGVFDSYLSLAEHRLLSNPVLQEISPVTRLYLGICKLHKDLDRMRRLCCDVFYFCGDFAVPFLFYVLTSWTEILPKMTNCEHMPLVKVLVQIVYMKDCNKPGYNLLPLRDLLIKFYGYPSERWDSDELFQELFLGYLRNPVRSSDFALLLLCKNHPEKWVHEKIEQHLKPLVDKIPNENFKAAVIILIGNLYHPFDKKADTNYLVNIRQWLTNLITESTPDVVKRSVYLCLNRLSKK